ncbi:MAG: DMT family transporter [Pikeienuella sp.]
MTARAGFTTILAVCLVGLLWGLNWPIVKFMLTEIPPITLRAVALSSAAIVLALLARAEGRGLRPEPEEIWPIIRTGLFMVCGFNLLTAIGQTMTETSRAAIIAYTMPAMTAALAAVFLKERLSARLLAALAVGLAGLAVLASENFAALARDPLGAVIMFGAALCWALGNVSQKSRAWTLSPLALTTWYFGISAVICLALAFALEPPWRQQWPGAPVVWTMVFHIIGPMVTAYSLWTLLLGRLPAAVAAITTLSAPVVGVVSSILLLGDEATWQKGVALVLVVLSILMTLIRRSGRR